MEIWYFGFGGFGADAESTIPFFHARSIALYKQNFVQEFCRKWKFGILGLVGLGQTQNPKYQISIFYRTLGRKSARFVWVLLAWKFGILGLVGLGQTQNPQYHFFTREALHFISRISSKSSVENGNLVFWVWWVWGRRRTQNTKFPFSTELLGENLLDLCECFSRGNLVFRFSGLRQAEQIVFFGPPRWAVQVGPPKWPGHRWWGATATRRTTTTTTTTTTTKSQTRDHEIRDPLAGVLGSGVFRRSFF